MPEALVKIKDPTALEIFKRYDGEEEVSELLEESTTPAQLIQTLLDQEMYVPLIRFLAHALPKREATWWACLAARSVLGEKPTPRTMDAITAAERWVFKPTEENRQVAVAAMKANKFSTPAALAASAAAWSGGSLTDPGEPVVQPPDDLTPTAVFSAVVMAAGKGGDGNFAYLFRGYIEQAIDIARGGNGRVKAKDVERSPAAG